MLFCAHLHMHGGPVGSNSQVAVLYGHALIIGRGFWADCPRVRCSCKPICLPQPNYECRNQGDSSGGCLREQEKFSYCGNFAVHPVMCSEMARGMSRET